MSLTSNIKGKTPIGEFLLNSVKLPELHPNALRNPKITHDGKRWSLIGTAFDYLVRMSLSSFDRGNFEPNIAQKALSNYLRDRKAEVDNDGIFGPIKLSQEDIDNRSKEDEQHQDNFSQCCAEVDSALKENDILSMATNSLSFARLDPFFRNSGWSESWDDEWASRETDPIDAEELVRLHELWVESFRIPEGELNYNPSFTSSGLVGGADADIIVGRIIIDWKVVNNPRRELRKYLAQMVGYALLSNLDGVPVETCTLYFARHGEQLSLPFTEIMNHTMEEATSLFKEIADPNDTHERVMEAVRYSNTSTNFGMYRDGDYVLPDEKRCIAISKSSGERCKAHRKRDSDMCHTHAPKVIIAIDHEEERGLIEMITETPNIPEKFWRKNRSRYATENSPKYASSNGWEMWKNSFPENHSMRKAMNRASSNGLWQSKISNLLIIHCSPGGDSIDAFLSAKGVLLSDYRTKWDKFWKAHELATDSETH